MKLGPESERANALRNEVAVGTVIFTVVVLATMAAHGPRLIDVLLALAVTIVVPLALHIDPTRREEFPASLRMFAALSAGVSLVPDPGVVAGLLATVWLVYASISLARVVLSRLRDRRLPDFEMWIALAARGFLAAGAGWLVVSRFGWRPLELADVIVELTAMHFHYAGFATTMLALRAARALGSRNAFVARLAGAIIIASSMVIAAGFVVDPRFQLAGAVPLALAVIGVGILTFVAASRVGEGAARSLLRVQAISPIAAMSLALVWVVGNQVSASPVSIDTMARTHGVLNAIGFVLCGLTGWTLADRGATAAASRHRR